MHTEKHFSLKITRIYTKIKLVTVMHKYSGMSYWSVKEVSIVIRNLSLFGGYRNCISISNTLLAHVDSWLSGKLPFECEKIAKNFWQHFFFITGCISSQQIGRMSLSYWLNNVLFIQLVSTLAIDCT